MPNNAFVNRELDALQRWWDAGDTFALQYGRRRVGKTWLAAQFAEGRISIVSALAARHRVDGRP